MHSFQAVDQKVCCPDNIELAVVRDDKGWNIPRIREKRNSHAGASLSWDNSDVEYTPSVSNQFLELS